MTLTFSKPFVRQYRKLAPPIRTKVDRQLRNLSQNPRHPGLFARKMTGYSDVWEARIDEHYRVTFQIVDDVIVVRRVGTHEIYRHP